MFYFLFAALVVLADRLLKIWVANSLGIGQTRRLIPGIVHLAYASNSGAAFSVLENMRWLLVAVSAVCVVALIIVVWRYRLGGLGRWGAAAVLGGAAGNLIDRLMSGSVVDMFEVEFMRFAIFNVADIFITVGGIVFCLHFLLRSGKGKKPETAASAEEDDEAPPAPPAARVHPAPPRYTGGKSVRERPVDVFLDEKDFTETRILEEYDIQRRISQYDENTPDE
jgi:signal peptidase II